MYFAISTDIAVIDVLPVLSGIESPELTTSIVAALADRVADRVATVLEQVVPSICIIATSVAVPMAARIAKVFVVSVLRFEASLAAVAVSDEGKLGLTFQKVWFTLLHAGCRPCTSEARMRCDELESLCNLCRR
jgi:hypothetical protein